MADQKELALGDPDMNAGGDAGKEVFAAIQNQLDKLAHAAKMQNLPKEVKRRVKSLKKLQFQMLTVESDFYKEVHELECKYASRYDPIFSKRAEILQGELEPTDSDCDWPSDEETELAESLQEKAAITNEVESTEKEAAAPVKGIPDFWLTVFKNVELLSDMVQEHDEEILHHLMEVKVKFLESNPMGFRLEFHFEENEFFTNRLLTKEYHMRGEPDKEDPFTYEGPEIVKCIGCDIDWCKGKNVTVRVVKKTQKHKNRGVKRTITKTVRNDSFFNFFTPPVQPEKAEGDEDEDEDDDQEALLAADFEIGHYIRERIVPRAVLYFTGEAMDDDDYDDDDDDEDEEDDEDASGEEEEDDPDYKPGEAGDQKSPDCKQQ